MQTYINQLVEDLNEKAQTKIEVPDYKALNPNNPALKAGLDYLVAWETAPYLTYFEVFGIANEAFPPVEKLNEEQAKQVVEAIVNLLEVNNIEVGFPENIPSYSILYFELRKEWQGRKMRIMPDDDGTIIDFCHYNGETCPWGMDFCTCKDEEWYNSDYEMRDYSKDDGELPF
jgi:hypothetical protein